MSMNESIRPRLQALKTTMTGYEYADRIAAYVLHNFGARGLMVYREVSLGKTIIGKNRHVDIFAVHPQTGRAFAVECKYQDSTGTVDEKIPYAIQDMQAMGMPGVLAYAGSGFSEGILHMLAGCPIAAYCLPSETLEPSKETRELDVALAMTFHWWDLVVANKKPFVVPAKVTTEVTRTAAPQPVAESAPAKVTTE